jgi:hypothetical protein
MSDEAPAAPLAVYMVADHLDGALAAGEDLAARGNDWRALAENPGDIGDFVLRQREIAEEVRSYELILIARMLKAREHAAALAQTDPRFAQIANLFVSGTNVLVDTAETCGDSRTADFETGDGLIAYVRSRGLISDEAVGVTQPSQFVIDDNFLVATMSPLGPLMDMAAAFLDALDVHYELFAENFDDDTDDTAWPATRSEFGRRERLPVN